MKKLLLSLLFTLIVNFSFAQDISGPKPVLSVGNQNITPDVSQFTLGCGNSAMTITANYVYDLGSPDSYRIEQIPFHEKSYLPVSGNTVLTPAQLGVPGQMISNLSDDTWSATQQLASGGSNLEFCYFGQPKTQFVVSSNGIISFDTSYANNYSSWTVHTMGKIEPNADCGDGTSGNNDSLLQFHDTNPADSDADFESYMFWAISGIEHERFLNMGTHHMPMFSCGADYGFATHQMLFYETTNIIEFNIRDKPLCETWANGWQAFGLQNNGSTVGKAVPGLDNQTQYQILNQTDPYNATHTNPAAPVHDSVSYRFVPDGPNGVIPVFGWYTNWDSVTNTGTLITNSYDLSVQDTDLPFDANGDPIPVTYTAVVTYVEFCSGQTYHATNDVTLEAIPVRMHIIENNAPDPAIETIGIEQINLCAGEDYLLQANVISNNPNVNYSLEWTVESFGNPATVIDDGDGDPLTYLISNASNPPDTYIYTCTLTATGDVNCVFSDQVAVTVFDSNTTMNYPAPKVYCANEPDPAPENVFPIAPNNASTTELESYYYTITNGGVWLNPLASDPTRSLDGIVDLSASFTNATTNNADGSANFDITYHAHCPQNVITDTIKVREAPVVLNPAIGDPTATPIIDPSPLIIACETNTTLHTADFNIDGINTYIANGNPLTDLNIVWESQTGGIIFPNPMPSTYNTTTVSAKVTVTLVSDPAACAKELLFDLTVAQQASIGTPVNNLKLCENDFSPGIATFNGTNIENTILMGQDSTVYTVHYSYVDASGVTQTFDGPLPANFDSPTRTYTATVSDASGNCPSNSINFDLEVRTIPLVTAPNTTNATLELCETDSINHTADFDTTGWDTLVLASNNQPVNTDFIIEYDYVDASGTSVTTNALPNPFTSGSQTITVRVSNKTAGEQTCTSGDETFNLVVNLKPVEIPQAPVITCSHVALAVDLNTYTSLSGNTYQWYADANANVSGATTTTQTGANITDTLVNTTQNQETVVYHIIPTSATPNSCDGDEFTITIDVNPEPVGTDTSLLTCSGIIANIDLNTITTLTGNTYSWTVTENPNVTGETIGTQTSNTITQTLTNTSTVNQDVIYTVTPTSVNGCIGNDFTVTINVGVEPIGTDPNLTVCSYNSNNSTSLNIDLDDTAITTLTGNTFSWVANDNPNVTGETVGTSTNGVISDSLTNTTLTAQIVTYTITPTSANGCLGNDFTVTVTVNPEPKAPITTLKNTCSDIALSLDLNSYITNLTTNDNTFSWTAVANGTVTGFTASGTANTITDTITNTSGASVDVTYTITPTSANGCVGENFDIVVTVSDEPVGTDSTLTICSDDSLIVNLNTLVNKVGTTFAWVATANGTVTGVTLNGTSANINNSINNVSNVPVDVTYIITPTNGCVGNDFTVVVTVNPEPVGTPPVTLDACSDVEFTINLEDYTSMSNTGNTYEWNAIDNPDVGVTGETTTLTTSNTIIETISNISATPQIVTYEITPISATGCRGNLFTIDVEVGQKPIELANPPILTPFCSKDILNIDLNTFTTLIGNTYEWIATDNTATNTNGDDMVTGETLTLTAGSTITDAIRNTSTTVQQVTYTITPTSANGCKGDDFILVVDIHPEPISENVEESACSDVAIDLDLTTYSSLSGNSYSWVATDQPNVTGETLINSTTTHITDNLTNVSNTNQDVIYTVTPTSINGCVGDSFEVKVTVGVEPVGNNMTIPSCSDDANFEINLNDYITNLSSNDYSFVWYAENNNLVQGETTVNSTGNLITDTLTNTSGTVQNIIYHIIPTSATPNSCEGNEFIITVVVGFEPVGTTTVETICNEEQLSLNLDNYTTLIGNTYTWSAIDNPNVTGETTDNSTTTTIDDTIVNTTNIVQTVEYMVTPISAGGCRGDEFLVAIDVNPRPQFELHPQYFICPDIHEVTIGENNPDNYIYHWYESNDMNVIIGYDETLLVTEADLAASNGTYVLTVIDSLGCTYSQFTSVSMAEQVEITQIHVSDFNRPENTIQIDVTGGSGQFEYTLNYIDYTGSPQSITQQSPIFEHVVAGSYQIEVNDLTGCSVAITSQDVYVLDYPPFFTPNGDLQHDTWQITGSQFIPTSKIYIFDRFGKVLAQVDPNSAVGWDGTYNGVQVPASDYWFTCEYIDPNTGKQKSVKGHFSIVRK